MAQVRQCGWQGCKNPVREGETRCYLHKDRVDSSQRINPFTAEGFAEEKQQWEAMKELSLIAFRRPPGAIPLLEKQGQLLQIDNFLDKKTAMQISDASDVMNGRRPELEIPSFVAKNIRPIVTEFKADLIESGIDPQRINELHMWGARRKLDGGRTEYSDVNHLILVIDRDTPEQTAVDAGISMFAPVSNPNRPVTEQIRTRFSPFGYAPLVTPLRDYTNPGYVWFDNFRYLDRQKSESIDSVRFSR